MFRFFRKKDKTPPAAAAVDVEADDDARAFAQADALQEELSDTPAHTPVPAFEPPTQRVRDTGVDLPAESIAPLPAVRPPAAPVRDHRPSIEEVEPAKPRAGWFARLRDGLRKTGTTLNQVFGDVRIDETLYEDLESALLMADAGVDATESLLAQLKERVRQTGASEAAAVRELLVDVLTEQLRPLEGHLSVGVHTPTVIMVAGVNGAGKTTSIGKLTRHLADAGCKVLLAAADTFRAAAKEQLAVWADRNQVQIVSQEGGDPAAVAFDAVTAGRARGCDVVIVDTAGRLATQAHLMDELRKIRRTIEKACPGAPHEVLLVVDGNTGQNALAQAKAFDAAIDITGLIVTKLDGTAKGGVLAAMARWSRDRTRDKPHARPVAAYFIGVGEALEDLERFDAREFARALLGGSD
jgi:fused signal recognition particle receptor